MEDEIRYVSIGGYLSSWVNPFGSKIATDKDKVLWQAITAAQNYTWMADDVASTDLDPAFIPRVDFTIWMRYYYKAFVRLVENWKKLAKNKTPTYDDLMTTLEATLREFLISLLALGADISDTESDKEIDVKTTQRVPRAQPFELFVQCLWTHAGDTKITNLGTLQSELSASKIVKMQRLHLVEQPDFPTQNYETGLPSVLFVCWHDRIATCSSEQWDSCLSRHRDFLRFARTERFGVLDIGNNNERDERTELKEVQVRIQDRWKFVQEHFKQHPQQFPDFEAKAKIGELPETTYNDFVAAMYHLTGESTYVSKRQEAIPLSRTTGFNHLGEVGRAFKAAGGKMLQETSRCWKCRFIHHYQIARPHNTVDDGLASPELPTQAVWGCGNMPMGCAEDLAHHLCGIQHNFQPSGPDPGSQLLVFLPYLQ